MTNSKVRQTVLDAVARLQRRSALVRFTQIGLRAVFYGLLAGALLALVVDPALLWPLLTLVAAVSVAGAAVASVLGQPSPVSVAKRYDDAVGGADRLSASLQLLESAGDPMVDSLLEEAATLAAKVEPARIYPWRLPREGYLLPVPVLLVFAFLLVPAWVSQADARSQVVEEALAQQAGKIQGFVAREKAKDPTPGRRVVLAKLEKLAAELTRKKLSKKDAMGELAKLMKELEDEGRKEDAEREELRKLVKNFQTNEKNRDLANEVNQGNYQDAANRIKKLMDEVRKKAKKLAKKQKKSKVDLEELRKLREQLKKLEDVHAKLMRLQNLQMDMNMRGEVMDFLEDVEGDLSELPEDDIEDRKFMRLGELNPNQGQNQNGPVPRMKQRMLMPPNKNAGRGTMEDFQGDEKRTDNTREEHRIKIREGKGQSGFSQVQVANDGSRSQKEAKEVYQAERRAAEDTMNRQKVPAGYREYLRRYFDGIQPDEGEREKK